MMTPADDRRQSSPPDELELYGKDVDKFIETERRKDWLAQLYETKSQLKTWRLTVGFCLLFNLILFSLAMWGWING